MSETCATDGLCETECPVNINTGTMVKDLRLEPDQTHRMVQFFRDHFKMGISLIRIGLKTVIIVEKIFGNTFIQIMTKWINTIFRTQLPHWPKSGIILANKFDADQDQDREYILFPSCSSRVLAADESGISSSEYLIKIAHDAQVKVKTLDDYPTQC